MRSFFFSPLILSAGRLSVDPATEVQEQIEFAVTFFFHFFLLADLFFHNPWKQYKGDLPLFLLSPHPVFLTAFPHWKSDLAAHFPLTSPSPSFFFSRVFCSVRNWATVFLPPMISIFLPFRLTP